MIEVSNLTKHYGPRTAISGLNFHVNPGEIVGFLGPNGAGKSTTMKILTGFMPASSGSAKVAGFDVFEQPLEVKRNVGFLPENPPVYMEMLVEDFLDFAARIHQVPSEKVSTAVQYAIEKTGLGDVRRRVIGNLSKGYKQRVGLAQAIIHNPKVLILDEPTVGFDPRQILEIRSLVKNLAGDHTIILSSHILPEVTATCNRVIVINQGKIVAEDTIEHLTARFNRKGTLSTMMVRNASDSGLQILRGISGVEHVDHQGQKISIRLHEDSSEIREKIIEAAVRAGMGVHEFSTEKASLEEVFLQLVTQESH